MINSLYIPVKVIESTYSDDRRSDPLETNLYFERLLDLVAEEIELNKQHGNLKIFKWCEYVYFLSGKTSGMNACRYIT